MIDLNVVNKRKECKEEEGWGGHIHSDKDLTNSVQLSASITATNMNKVYSHDFGFLGQISLA